MQTFERQCRICLRKGEKMHPLVYQVDVVESSQCSLKPTKIGEMFLDCMQLTLSLPYGAPDHLCSRCEQNLQSVQKMRLLAFKSTDKVLKVLAEGLKNLTKIHNETARKKDESQLIKTDKFKDELSNSEMATVIKEESEDVYDCNFCGKTFLSDTEVKQHTSKNHPFCCEICSLSVESQQHLNVHNSEFHEMLNNSEKENLNATPKQKQHKCPFCTETFPKTNHRSKHIKLKHQFICLKCGTTFRYENRLQAHKRVHEGRENPWKCEVCSKDLTKLSTYLEHMQQHTGQKAANKCDKCDYTSSRRSDVEKHKVIHTDLKNYLCDLCGKSYGFKSGFLNHLKYGHTNENTMKCKACPMTFKNPVCLRKHTLAVHLNVRHKCSVCPQSFKRKYLLVSHLEKHEKEENIQEETIDDEDLLYIAEESV